MDVVSPGSDGAKLLSIYAPTAPAAANALDQRKRLTLRFYPANADPFVVYVIDETRQRK